MLAYNDTFPKFTLSNNVVLVLGFLAVIIICQLEIVSCSDAEILLKFKQSLTNTDGISNWNTSIPPCTNNTRNWEGVICKNNGLFGIRLDNMGLKGIIDIDSLTQLLSLRSISLTNNSFSGPLPAINKLIRIKMLYLAYNNFSGKIPENAFDGMTALRKVYMGNNSFIGELPKSLVDLPKLVDLSLEYNQFSGHVPSFMSTDFRLLNLSCNFFEGRIPSSLSHMNSTTYLGNPGLCGQPLQQCKPSSSQAMIIIIVCTVALLLLLTVFFLAITRYPSKHTYYQTSTRDDLEGLRSKKQSNGGHSYSSNQSRGLDRPTSYKKSDNGKLIFLRNDRQKFEMQDLLKASAEVLGSGSFGSSYKATIVNGPTFVVKRFRRMNNVGKEEFQDHMKKLGGLRHTNVLPLVAFFCKRDEKLIISDFVENGSLASHLHGGRTQDQTALRWSTRLKIIKGVARGLAYLYRELPQLDIPHGHLKSSNVLLDEHYEPLLSDYALSPLMNKDHAEQVMVAYKAPEFTQTNMITKKTDVWCLGVLILEILTGKFPTNYLKHGKGGVDDLAAWVNSVAKEEWTSDLFDVEMKASTSNKGQMLKLLKIGMWCCEWNVEKRWNLREAVEKIEELKESDNDYEDEDYLSSHGSERELFSTISSINEDNVSFRGINID